MTQPEPAPEEGTPIFTEPVVEETSAEDASDAELRAWAKDNGIEGVPGSGKLSAAWREQITNAMAAALDPKDEASVEATSSESSTSLETMNETSEEEVPPSAEEPEPEPEVEYRSVFQAPNTFVTSQQYTN